MKRSPMRRSPMKRTRQRDPVTPEVAIEVGLQLHIEPFISNPRARISDLRKQGIDVQCRKRPDGRDGFGS